jgi:hypothetical protein
MAPETPIRTAASFTDNMFRTRALSGIAYKKQANCLINLLGRRLLKRSYHGCNAERSARREY